MKWIRLILLVCLVWGIWFACRSGKPANADAIITTNQQPPSLKKEKDVCEGLNKDLAQKVIAISENLAAQQLAYNSLPLTDCSGIFHRVLDSLREQCPKQSFPDKSYRSSRGLARWYHEKGMLQLVHDPLTFGDRLKPGLVVFFARIEDRQESSLSVESLTQPGGINHVGVITSVTKDASGTIQNYEMFHGLRPGKAAQITRYHHRNPSRETYPPYGNGSQSLVAIAPIVSD